MLFLGALTSLALATLAAAQANSSTLAVEAIEAHFAQAGLSGSGNTALFPTFEPSALLNVTYEGAGSVAPGQALSAAQAKPQPSITVTAANASVTLTGRTFTVMMVDADIVGTDESGNQTRHWLVNGVTVGANGALDYSGSTAHGDYAGPGPAAGSGAHRYCIVLYDQPQSFSSPADVTDGVAHIHLADYVKASGLGAIVAGTYITVEEGTGTASVSATSAVVTSTLAAAQSTAASASGSHSGSAASGSHSGTGSGSAAAPTGSGSSNGAASFKAFAPAALVAGLVGAAALL